MRTLTDETFRFTGAYAREPEFVRRQFQGQGPGPEVSVGIDRIFTLLHSCRQTQLQLRVTGEAQAAVRLLYQNLQRRMLRNVQARARLRLAFSTGAALDTACALLQYRTFVRFLFFLAVVGPTGYTGPSGER